MARFGATVMLGLLGCAVRPPPPIAVAVPAVPAVPGPSVVERVLAAATARTDPARAAPAHAAALDEVARVAAASAAARYVISADELRAAIGDRLGSGLDPYVLTARGDDTTAAIQLAAALAELRADAGVASVGAAEATGATGRVVAVIAMPPPSRPVAIERAGSIARVAVPWPWPDPPRAFDVTGADSQSLAAPLHEEQVELIVDCARRASETIELDAGDQLVASVVNVCGPTPRPPPSSTDVGPAARTAVEVEQRLFEQINRDRVAEGRAPIAWDAGAQRMARKHAARMNALGFVGHVAPDGEDLTERVRTAGLPATETFENVGLADGPGRAHLAFMASPGHRRNLLAERARRGGVGVVWSGRDPGWFYVTEVFFEPLR